MTPDNGAQPSAPGPADLASGPFYDSTTHKVDYADPGPAAPPRTPGRADTVSTQRPAFDGVSAYQADYTEKSVPRESVSRKKADDVPPSMPLNAATSYGTDFRPVAGGAARLAAPRRAAAQSGQWAPGALRSQYAVAYDEKPRVAERFTRPATASHLPSAPFDGNTIHRMTYPAYQPSPARRPATAGAARSSVPRPFYGSSEYRDRYVPKPMMAGDGGGGATSVPTAAIPPAPFFASTEYGSEYVRLKVAGAAASARPRQPESAGPMMPRSFVGDTTYNRAFTTAMMPVVRDVRTRRQEAVPDVSPPFANHTMYATDYVPLKLPSRTMCADRPWTTCDSCK